MTTIDKAVEVILGVTQGVDPFVDARRIAQALATAGLLTPEPHVVTREQVARIIAPWQWTDDYMPPIFHGETRTLPEIVESHRAQSLAQADAIMALLTTPAEKGGA